MAGKRASHKRTEPLRMVGYLRVSTQEQGRSGLGLEAQRTAIEEAARRRGWELVAIEVDVASGRKKDRRPGLERAQERCRSGDATGIVAAKLDRLSRSVIGFADLVKRSRDEGWNLIVLDHALDLSTASGRMVAGILSVLAQWEAELVTERTRSALDEARAKGKRLGRPALIPKDTLRLVRYWRRRGFSFAHIADLLNVREIERPTGGLWDDKAARHAYLRAESLGRALRKPRVVPPPRPVERRLVLRSRSAG